jgi:hypothetical protein
LAGISLIANRNSVILYRTFSYRDGLKNPRNSRKAIGKVVKGTGEVVFNDYFMALLARQGLSLPELRGKSLAEVSRLVDFKAEPGAYRSRRLDGANRVALSDPRLDKLAAKEMAAGPFGGPPGGASAGAWPEPAPGQAEPAEAAPPKSPDRLLEFIYERLGAPGARLKHAPKPLVVKSVGAQLLLETVAADLGLTGLLEEIFPDVWRELLTLSFHLISGQNILEDTSGQLDRVAGIMRPGELSPARLYAVLGALGEDRRDRFCRSWAERLGETGFTAYNIDSIISERSPRSNIFLDHARSGRRSTGLNLALILGAASRLPVRAATYASSPSDAAAFLAAVRRMGLPWPEVKYVLDQGFYGPGNLALLLDSSPPGGFLMQMPVDAEWALSVIKQITESTYVVNFLYGGKPLFTLSAEYRVEGRKPLTVHAFLDERSMLEAEKDVYHELFLLKSDLEGLPAKLADPANYEEYFRLDRSGPAPELKVRHHQATMRYLNRGWLLAIADKEAPLAKILDAFDVKERADDHFHSLRAHLDLHEPRTGVNSLNDRKIFVSLLSMILLSHIRNVLQSHNLDRQATVPRLIRELTDVKAAIDGRTIVHSVPSDLAKRILAAFGIITG